MVVREERFDHIYVPFYENPVTVTKQLFSFMRSLLPLFILLPFFVIVFLTNDGCTHIPGNDTNEMK